MDELAAYWFLLEDLQIALIGNSAVKQINDNPPVLPSNFIPFPCRYKWAENSAIPSAEADEPNILLAHSWHSRPSRNP
jgi:hypothetical protein